MGLPPEKVQQNHTVWILTQYTILYFPVRITITSSQEEEVQVKVLLLMYFFYSLHTRKDM